MAKYKPPKMPAPEKIPANHDVYSVRGLNWREPENSKNCFRCYEVADFVCFTCSRFLCRYDDCHEVHCYEAQLDRIA